jgi:hypothetical protein
MTNIDFVNLDWLVSPVTQYGIIGTGLLGCLGLWIAVKRELRTVRSRLANSRESIDMGLQNLSSALEEVRNLQKADPPPAMPKDGFSLNLTKRAQALRMYRRGETVASIAAALQTPSTEIELLLKVDRLLESHAR